MGYRGLGSTFLFVLFFCLGISSTGIAAKKSCAQLVQDAVPPGILRATAVARLKAASAEDWIKELTVQYRKHLKDRQFFGTIFPPTIVYPILANYKEMPYYPQQLKRVLDYYERYHEKSPFDAMTKALRVSLRNRVPKDAVQPRIDALGDGDMVTTLRALGDNSVDEMKRLFVGDDIHEIDPASLVAKYIKATGATTKIHRFPIAPGSQKLGEERLLVSVGPDSLEQFESKFSAPELFAMLGHALLFYQGEVVGIQFSEFRMPHLGSVLPFVVLKTTEGQRMERFIELQRTFNGGWGNAATTPWVLEGYCATGGYPCCTRWIGDMPIGDRLVNSYSFPGRTENGEPPVTQTLRAYEHENPLVHQVWAIPGHEQFADAVGQRKANLRGEFASTGWVFQTLLGPTTNQRVPVVMYVSEDHTQPIPDEFVPQYEQPM